VKPSHRRTAKLFMRRTAATCAGAKARPHVARPHSGTRKVSDDEGKNRSAYRLIKALVTSGELRAGARLDPEKLREIADASLTTTYNALRGLLIERLIEGSPASGFHMPALTEAGIRGRYAWTCDIAIQSVRCAAPAIDDGRTHPSPVDGDQASDPIQTAERLFAGIAALPEIFEYQLAMAQANDRLRPLRRYEGVLLNGVETELSMLERLFRLRDADGLATALARYRASLSKPSPLNA